MRSLHDGFTNKVGQLVGVLHRSGQTQSALKKEKNQVSIE